MTRQPGFDDFAHVRTRTRGARGEEGAGLTPKGNSLEQLCINGLGEVLNDGVSSVVDSVTVAHSSISSLVSSATTNLCSTRPRAMTRTERAASC